MTQRKQLSIVLIAIGCAFLAAIPFYVRLSEPWEPKSLSAMGLIAVGFLVMGALFSTLDGIERRQSPDDSDRREVKRLVDTIENGVISTLGGIATGLVFALCYYLVDFQPGGDISERRLAEICLPGDWPQFIGLPLSKPPEYPSVFKLLPEFIFLGAIVGMLLGFLFSRWVSAWKRAASERRWLAWTHEGVASYLFFGVFWGLLLGGVFNVALFGKNDGRPFLRIHTAALAASISIIGSVFLEFVLHRKRFTERIVGDLIGLVVFAVVLTSIVLMADQAFHLSEVAYCHFYEAWDARSTRMQTTPKVLFVATVYGGSIGLLVMTIYAAYRKASSSHSRFSLR